MRELAMKLIDMTTLPLKIVYLLLPQETQPQRKPNNGRVNEELGLQLTRSFEEELKSISDCSWHLRAR